MRTAPWPIDSSAPDSRSNTSKAATATPGKPGAIGFRGVELDAGVNEVGAPVDDLNPGPGALVPITIAGQDVSFRPPPKDRCRSVVPRLARRTRPGLDLPRLRALARRRIVYRPGSSAREQSADPLWFTVVENRTGDPVGMADDVELRTQPPHGGARPYLVRQLAPREPPPTRRRRTSSSGTLSTTIERVASNGNATRSINGRAKPHCDSAFGSKGYFGST